ncbi:MAG: glycogen synthase GlgA [Verrucomicrobiota bacterium]|jgi:starch synthase|nr:glycogen synthase GlgA [Verrucomicrobiota bacterium]
MQIWMAASEMAPYAKTGGLADVLADLPAALAGAGAEVTCVLPFYRAIWEKIEVEDLGMDLSIELGDRQVRARILQGKADDGVRLFFIRRDEYFDRSSLYGTTRGDYDDNSERFIFFSKAACQLPRLLNQRPDIFHAHDWQTALVPLFIKLEKQVSGFFSGTGTVFTIHNLAYQGTFWGLDFPMMNLPDEFYSPAGLEFYGNINLMKAGILFADRLTTVSPTYAQEIQTQESGCGLHEVIRSRARDLHGILNGVNRQKWDPAVDPLIPAQYSVNDLSGKWTCRKALLEEMGLGADPKRKLPILGWVGRLAEQKGLDILLPAMDSIVDLPVRVVFLGSGDERYEQELRELEKRYPGSVAVRIGYDNRLAHLIEAGADLFLMPSRFEPCGLNQLYSLVYGTVPIVRSTGGLADTVRDWDGRSGNGFRFNGYDSPGLLEAVGRAVAAFHAPGEWARIQAEGMKEDHSWDRVAARYMEVYGGI